MFLARPPAEVPLAKGAPGVLGEEDCPQRGERHTGDEHPPKKGLESGTDMGRCRSETINCGKVAEGAGMNNKRTVAEFFAGIGLMRMGLEEAGWQVVWANDIDEDKMKMYRGHFTDDEAHFHLGDVHAITPDDIPDVAA
jgi:hypothetical protein